jgi:hypothetical protein
LRESVTVSLLIEYILLNNYNKYYNYSSKNKVYRQNYKYSKRIYCRKKHIKQLILNDLNLTIPKKS